VQQTGVIGSQTVDEGSQHVACRDDANERSLVENGQAATDVRRGS
jgi:hypothetical protein